MSSRLRRAPVSVRVRIRARKSARGLTLIEILVVLGIIALISGGIAIVVIRHFENARIETARTSARTLRSAVSMWKMNDATGECPTTELLVKQQVVDSAAKTTDPWDRPFIIECADNGDINVVSGGPDRKLGTPDDIRVPEPPKASARATE
jgi:general secretion pathway protein G